MANLTVVPASMRLVGVDPISGELSATVAAGEVVQKVDGKYLKAQADSEANATAVGIALAPGTTGDIIPIAPLSKGGSIALGASVVKGTTYVLSATAGKVAPQADLTTSDYVTLLGVASDTSLIKISGFATGIQL